MTLITILAIVYAISAIIVASVHWAAAHDEKDEITMAQRVLNLYVVPLCPVVNTIIAAGILINYLERY